MNYSAASEVNSGRINGTLVRYIKTFEDDCLEVEVVNSGAKLSVLSSMHLCSFEGKPFSTGFAYAGFQDITFEKDGIHLTLSITPLEPTGEEVRECVIPIAEGNMSDLQCSSARRLN
ncbi:hypothetical protein D9M71_774520 [compost metagenome]|uniref:hypothetical protein n=1 Tax=Pseudomonas fluorescens TaxID=294 RepID=UPI000FB35BAE|nr:hypothetical protein [Pseudomonas fluorescens]